jgi:hypothetical protein
MFDGSVYPKNLIKVIVYFLVLRYADWTKSMHQRARARSTTTSRIPVQPVGMCTLIPQIIHAVQPDTNAVLWLVRVAASLGVRACACRFCSVLWSAAGIVCCDTNALIRNCTTLPAEQRSFLDFTDNPRCKQGKPMLQLLPTTQ